MTESSFPGLDVLVPLRWLLFTVAVFAVVFRRFFWVRSICVLLALVSVVFGCIRIDVAPRMAVDRLSREGKPWTEAFRDGSLYTFSSARTSIPTFLLVSVVLATLAFVPPKSPRKHNDKTRDA